MNVSSLAVLVLGQSETELADFVRRSPTAKEEANLVLFSNPRRKFGGYATIANGFISERQEDVVGIVHADTGFGAGALRTFAENALLGRLVGIVGRAASGPYVWGRDGGGEVSTLDSCSVFFPRALGLRFDGVLFDDFHCVVEDLCLQARSRGIGSFVPATDASHAGSNQSPGWLSNYQRYRQRLEKKWKGVRFLTT